MNLLERVKELCKEKGVSQRKLEKDLELGNGTSSKWSKSSPSSDLLEKIADYFNVSVDYLLGKTEIEHTPQKWSDETLAMMEEVHKNPELRMLFKATKDLSPEDIKKTINIIKAFKGDLD